MHNSHGGLFLFAWDIKKSLAYLDTGTFTIGPPLYINKMHSNPISKQSVVEVKKNPEMKKHIQTYQYILYQKKISREERRNIFFLRIICFSFEQTRNPFKQGCFVVENLVEKLQEFF